MSTTPTVAQPITSDDLRRREKENIFADLSDLDRRRGTKERGEIVNQPFPGYKYLKNEKGKVLVGKGLTVQAPISEIKVDDED